METGNKFCPVMQWFADTTGLMMKRVERFTVLDWAMFKTCLVALGTLMGVKFSKALRPFAPLIGLVFFVTWFLTALTLFGDPQRD